MPHSSPTVGTRRHTSGFAHAPHDSNNHRSTVGAELRQRRRVHGSSLIVSTACCLSRSRSSCDRDTLFCSSECDAPRHVGSRTAAISAATGGDREGRSMSAFDTKRTWATALYCDAQRLFPVVVVSPAA